MTRHGRLGTAMSVFQDVTAVPFRIISLPVTGHGRSIADRKVPGHGAAEGAGGHWAVVLVAGRYLSSAVHLVAETALAELFTLNRAVVSPDRRLDHQRAVRAVDGVRCLSGRDGWLGETEFRHQVESTIVHSVIVLLGLFSSASACWFETRRCVPDIWLEGPCCATC